MILVFIAIVMGVWISGLLFITGRTVKWGDQLEERGRDPTLWLIPGAIIVGAVYSGLLAWVLFGLMQILQGNG